MPSKITKVAARAEEATMHVGWSAAAIDVVFLLGHHVGGHIASRALAGHALKEMTKGGSAGQIEGETN
jgi:hypothetical protein